MHCYSATTGEARQGIRLLGIAISERIAVALLEGGIVLRKALYLILPAAVVAAGFGLANFRAKTTEARARRVLYYVDPMHPSYRSEKPGIAPDCGMALVAVYAEDVDKPARSSEAASPERVRVDSGAQQLYGIRVAKVEKDAGRGSIRVFGRVAADETRVFTVNVGTDGFVKETYDDSVGNRVHRDQHLAIVYSPEFLSLAGGYLSANERTPGSASNARENLSASAAQGAASAQARADRLRNLGMSDAQIVEIGNNHKIPEDIYIVSPTDGFILSRGISPGLRFERGKELYKIADLSHVWIMAEVFGKDAELFRPGAVARVTVPDTGETFQARVSNVVPEVDPVSRTLRARLEADNPGFKLRPDMFVNVELPISLSPGLTAPADAVLDSGLAKRVYVQTAADHFEAREVETGWRLGGRVQILSGVREGESVVVGGTFLVDSESRLQAAANSPHGLQ